MYKGVTHNLAWVCPEAYKYISQAACVEQRPCRNTKYTKEMLVTYNSRQHGYSSLEALCMKMSSRQLGKPTQRPCVSIYNKSVPTGTSHLCDDYWNKTYTMDRVTQGKGGWVKKKQND